MLDEVVRCLRPTAGDVAVDCTVGGGGHALAILRAVGPGGRLIGLDLDAPELQRTEARLRAAGFGPETFVPRHATFGELRQVLAREGVAAADVILADLGVSSMQSDDRSRGFSYKLPGPLDMRMDRSRGEAASDLIARCSREALAALLTTNADEPHATLIAGLLEQTRVTTTHDLERLVRTGLNRAYPDLTKAEVKVSVRRTFQALRIAVNDEFAALETLLSALPMCLAPGGRVAVLTFHSGEDRRVKQALRRGYREGVYAAIADRVIRSRKDETYANRRAAAAKLRWAVRR
jgi:16S rRNA (cytosine1402-N4)-methyltransferase